MKLPLATACLLIYFSLQSSSCLGTLDDAATATSAAPHLVSCESIEDRSESKEDKIRVEAGKHCIQEETVQETREVTGNVENVESQAAKDTSLSGDRESLQKVGKEQTKSVDESALKKTTGSGDATFSEEKEPIEELTDEKDHTEEKHDTPKEGIALLNIAEIESKGDGIQNTEGIKEDKDLKKEEDEDLKDVKLSRPCGLGSCLSRDAEKGGRRKWKSRNDDDGDDDDDDGDDGEASVSKLRKKLAKLDGKLNKIPSKREKYLGRDYSTDKLKRKLAKLDAKRKNLLAKREDCSQKLKRAEGRSVNLVV